MLNAIFVFGEKVSIYKKKKHYFYCIYKLSHQITYVIFLIYHILDDDSKTVVNIKSYSDIDSYPRTATFVEGMKNRS